MEQKVLIKWMWSQETVLYRITIPMRPFKQNVIIDKDSDS